MNFASGNTASCFGLLLPAACCTVRYYDLYNFHACHLLVPAEWKAYAPSCQLLASVCLRTGPFAAVEDIPAARILPPPPPARATRLLVIPPVPPRTGSTAALLACLMPGFAGELLLPAIPICTGTPHVQANCAWLSM
jgi:hypothetical protein